MATHEVTPRRRYTAGRVEMLQFCLMAAGAVIHLHTSTLTLGWTHSVEKIRWEENYRLTKAGILVTQDRLQGTGAGMEPPPDATFDGTWFRYTPTLPPQPKVILRRSGMTASDWDVCIDGRCRAMATYLPEGHKNADPVTLAPCPR